VSVFMLLEKGAHALDGTTCIKDVKMFKKISCIVVSSCLSCLRSRVVDDVL